MVHSPYKRFGVFFAQKEDCGCLRGLKQKPDRLSGFFRERCVVLPLWQRGLEKSLLKLGC